MKTYSINTPFYKINRPKPTTFTTFEPHKPSPQNA